MAKYAPRLVAPDKSNKFYYNSTYNPFYPTYGMPNCTCYAFGRFSELLGKRASLHTGDAGTWYGHTSDGYPRGTTPRLGAVICWSNPGKAGHVAIVEQINSDGSIVTSNSAWKGTNFYTQTLRPPDYKCGSTYKLQGFIYNPAVSGNVIDTPPDKLALFLKEAKSHIGEDGTWTYRTSGLTKGQPWCAAFVTACAKAVGGISNIIIPFSYSTTDTTSRGVANGMGKWFPGPAQGKFPTPLPGDLVTFRWYTYSKSEYPSTYSADHIEIVCSVDSERVHTISGNRGGNGGHVMAKDYLLTYNCINGFYRPDWAKVGANVANLAEYMLLADAGMPLYDIVNTREDATLREIGYVDSSMEPSISTSNIQLSVINYTTYLSSIGAMIGGSVTGDSDTYISFESVNLDAVKREILSFLTSKGLNVAASIGILANIEKESGCRTSAVGDSGTSFGLCQWHAGRGAAMKKMAGASWANNLTGQLEYLWYELTNSYTYVLDPLKNVPNTEAGAKQAADIFVRKFEIPAGVDQASLVRQAQASIFWKSLIPQLTTTGAVI